MRITRVEAIPLWAAFAEVFGGLERVPERISHPAFGMQSAPLLGQGCVIVRIHTDTGVVGIGESMGRPGPAATAAYINDVLAPILINQDPLEVERHWTVMSEQLDFAPMAISGLDIALWDIRGRSIGQPVWRCISGRFREAIPCYASPIPYMAAPEDSARAAKEFVEAGHRSVKLKIGRGLSTDLDHVAAVRAAVGSDVQLLVDCNGAYGVADSVRLGKELIRSNVGWLEEPVHRFHRSDLAEVRRRVDLPIASGEWLASIYEFRDLIDSGAVDVVMPNITRCGGITGLMRVAQAAELRNLNVAPHGVGSGVGIVAALHASTAAANFLIYEYNQLLNPLRDGVLAAPLQFGEGLMHVPDGEGLGIALNETSVARYRLPASEAVTTAR